MGPTDDNKSEVENSLSTPAPSEQEQTPEAVDAVVAEEPTATPEPTPAPTPVPTPAPTPSPEPTPAPTPDPVIASTVTIPASSASEGGEWNLLQEKIQDWINANQLSTLWQQVKLPVQILAAVIVLILAVQIYGGIIRTIAAVPLAPGLLELAGVIAVINFSARRLVKSSERKQALQSLRDLWSQVVGR